jgi:hypothetical protein
MNNRQTNTQSMIDRARQAHERSAPCPFSVGETYANRLGKYEVMELRPPKMTIRYEDGALVTAEIAILARIWDNLQMPPEQPEPRGRGTGKPAAQPRTPRTAPRFQGLAARDFAPGAARAAWRSQLGSLIAARLGEITGIVHKAFPVENRPELYIGREHHFNGRFPEHRAKFLFRLTGEAAEYGFCVESDSHKMDLTWDWRRFIATLQKPGVWAEQVETAMRERGLEAEAESTRPATRIAGQEPGQMGRWTAVTEGLAWFPAGESTPAACTWQDMADRLTGVEPELGCDFYLLGRTTKDEAVALGERLIERAAQTCAALMPLYSASAR